MLVPDVFCTTGPLEHSIPLMFLQVVLNDFRFSHQNSHLLMLVSVLPLKKLLARSESMLHY